MRGRPSVGPSLAVSPMTHPPSRHVDWNSALWAEAAHEALAHLGYGLIACDARGRTLSYSPRALWTLNLLAPQGHLAPGVALPPAIAIMVQEASDRGRPVRVGTPSRRRAFYLSVMGFVSTTAPASEAVLIVVREEGTRTTDALASIGKRYQLAARDVRILSELRRGRSNRQIAARFGWRENTVKGYVKDLYQKLGVHRRAEVAALVHATLGEDD
jgi:DNA-binding CsgD family transcriptional regulator